MLQAQLRRLAEVRELVVPPPELCVDNGVMIAWAALLMREAGALCVPGDELDIRPRWPLAGGERDLKSSRAAERQ